MFEGVKGQNIVKRMLEREINGDRLPATLLFHGPDGCGKFLTALELARIINCSKQRGQECSCISCISMKRYISRNIFIISKSNLWNTFSLWSQFGVNEESFQYFLKDLRRLLLSSPEMENNKKELQNLASLFTFPQDLLHRSQEVLGWVYDILERETGKIIPIDMIRDVQRFLSLKSGDNNYRVVIIDGADNMNEEASNSFLKISEDTPPNAIIILTAVNKAALKETIISRCRLYRFIDLSDEDFKGIIRDNFGFKGEIGKKYLIYNYDGMEKYYDRIIPHIQDLDVISSISEEILKNNHTVTFLNFTLQKMKERALHLNEVGMEEIYECEGLLKRVSSLKQAILHYNANQEIVLTDFMLNILSNVVKFYNIGANAGETLSKGL